MQQRILFTTTDVKKLIATEGDRTMLIDVRLPREVTPYKSIGGNNIPLDQLYANSKLIIQYAKLGYNIVPICYVNRSNRLKEAMEILKEILPNNLHNSIIRCDVPIAAFLSDTNKPKIPAVPTDIPLDET